MSETTYYSALHYAKKAEKSAQEAAEKAASVNAENLVKTYGDNTIEGTLTVADNSNHPITIEGMAGTTATGFQITDSNGQGETDLEHYATGDRYGTRLLNRSTATGKEFNVDMYQTTAGKSVLDLSKADSVLVKGDKDLLTNVVDVTSNQTVGGAKTFTSPILRKMSNVVANVAPTQDQYIDYISPSDKNGESLGYLGIADYTDGRRTSRIGHTRKQADGSYIYQSLDIGSYADGTVFTKAPTPPVSDNSTQIATTAFVSNKFQVVTALPSSPTAGVFYFIKE